MRIVLLMIALHVSFFSLAQESVMSDRRQFRKVYLGVDNPIDVFVEGYKCSSLFVTTDNGVVEKYGCAINFRPAKLGPAKLSIYRKQNGKSTKIKTYNWEVQPIPPPVAQVGPYQNGAEVQKGGFIAQQGVVAFSNIPGFDLMYKVQNFSFIIIYDSTIKFSTHITGNLFNEEIINACKALQSGSVILISNIWAFDPARTKIKVNPLEYLIK